MKRIIMTLPNGEEILFNTRKETAEFAKISPNSIDRYIAEGTKDKNGNRYRYATEEEIEGDTYDYFDMFVSNKIKEFKEKKATQRTEFFLDCFTLEQAMDVCNRINKKFKDWNLTFEKIDDRYIITCRKKILKPIDALKKRAKELEIAMTAQENTMNQLMNDIEANKRLLAAYEQVIADMEESE